MNNIKTKIVKMNRRREQVNQLGSSGGLSGLAPPIFHDNIDRDDDEGFSDDGVPNRDLGGGNQAMQRPHDFYTQMDLDDHLLNDQEDFSGIEHADPRHANQALDFLQPEDSIGMGHGASTSRSVGMHGGPVPGSRRN